MKIRLELNPVALGYIDQLADASGATRAVEINRLICEVVRQGGMQFGLIKPAIADNVQADDEAPM